MNARGASACALALLALAALTSCGGGGGSAAPAAAVDNGTPAPVPAPAWRFDTTTAAAALSDNLGLAESALALLHVAAAQANDLARVGPLPRSVNCGGGNGSADLIDRDGDGVPGAGDTIVVDYSRCGLSPAGAAMSGRLQIDIQLLSGDGLQLQATLSMPTGLEWTPGYLKGPTGLWQGQLRVETRSEPGRTTWAARAAATDQLRFTWSGSSPGTDTVEQLLVQRVLGHTDARVQWTASLDTDSGRRGGRYQLRTPVALAAYAGYFPDAVSGMGRFELSDAAGTLVSAVPVVTDDFTTPQRIELSLRAGNGGNTTALPVVEWYDMLIGLGLWSGLDAPSWPLRRLAMAGLRVITTVDLLPYEMHRPLRLLFSQPLAAGSVPQFRLETQGHLGTQAPAQGEPIPMTMERDGLMVTLRPTVVVPDSTRVRLLVSMDGGFVPTTTVMIAADDGSVMSVHGGVLRGDSTPDRLRPVITGASRRSLLRAGTSVDLSALASYDAAWITGYEWTQTEGVPLHLGSPQARQTVVSLAGGSGVAYATVRLALRNAAGQQAHQDLVLKTVQAGATTWMLYLQGEADDFVVGDRTDYFTEQIGRFTLYNSIPAGAFRFRYDEGHVSDWNLELAAADRLPLRVGRYEGARRATLGAPLIEFAGEGRICAQVEGSFEVFEIERDGAGEIVRAAVDFQQRCEGSSGGLVGALRFNSNRPLPGSAQPASR